VKTEKKQNVFFIVLNRPEKLNSLIEPMREEMATAIESLHNQDDISACVITGADRGFCAGGDIKVMKELIEKGSFERIQTFLEFAKSIILGIRSLPIPVIAAVNGPAAGCGMNLALACDIRLASDRATFGETFINIGLLPDWGGTYFLPRIVGPSRALELIWTGRVIDASEAQMMKIVDFVVPHDDFEKYVDEFVQNLASRSGKVIALSKKIVYEELGNTLEEVMRQEELAQSECIRSKEALNSMRRFLNERAMRKVQKGKSN
jgi:2-(1,2-epoxy-1,2-dihydrophenyl)acetyl-CoA isomerase